MIYYIQAFLLTFIEALCCKNFFDIFFESKNRKRNRREKVLFAVLFLGFIGISLIQKEKYVTKAMLTVALISCVMFVRYRTKYRNIFFWASAYYGILICIDRIMIVLIEYSLGEKAEKILNSPINVTILALICKMVLFLLIVLLNKVFQPQNSFNMIRDKEWFRFLLFPIVSIICMSAMALEERYTGKIALIVSLALVFFNFQVFYIIRDVVSREKEVREALLSNERIRNQMEMYRYMETVYYEQRKKTHEFKNYILCLSGLMKNRNYSEMENYLNQINTSWIEGIDLINTNHAIVNSVLNQKIKSAKKKGIPILLSVNDLKNVSIKEEDLVTLLANLLDNAIEACEKIEDGKKIIKFRFLNENEKITISVRNTVAESVNCSPAGIPTTKRNKQEHGIGMMNIQNVVDKYGGESIISCNEGFFTYSVIIDRANK